MSGTSSQMVSGGGVGSAGGGVYLNANGASGGSTDPRRRGADGAAVVKAESHPPFPLREDCEYVVPDNVYEIEVLLVGAGGGATEDRDGEDGEVAIVKLAVKPGQRLDIKVGRGGGPGEDGGDTSATPVE